MLAVAETMLSSTKRDEGENVYEAQRAKLLTCDATAFPFILQVMIELKTLKSQLA